MILNYREFGTDRRRAVFFLHGLLGNAENWSSTCRELSEAGICCIAVDQRNHGASPHSSTMDYPLMADDLFRLADSMGIEKFSIAGHSMGGKTAMEAALSRPGRIRSLLVADIAPVRYAPAYVDYINSLKLINLDGVKRRSDADARLAEYIPDRSLRMFFLTNLRRDDEGFFNWRINIDGITDNYDNIWSGLAVGRQYDGPVLFVRGGESDFILDEHTGIIGELFPEFVIETIRGSGHWVHTEKPSEFRRIATRFFSD